MFKNRLAKLGEIDFLSRLTTALAPADENVFRQAREHKGTTETRQPNRSNGYFTVRHLGSV